MQSLQVVITGEIKGKPSGYINSFDGPLKVTTHGGNTIDLMANGQRVILINSPSISADPSKVITVEGHVYASGPEDKDLLFGFINIDVSKVTL